MPASKSKDRTIPIAAQSRGAQASLQILFTFVLFQLARCISSTNALRSRTFWLEIRNSLYLPLANPISAVFVSIQSLLRNRRKLALAAPTFGRASRAAISDLDLDERAKAESRNVIAHFSRSSPNRIKIAGPLAPCPS